MVRFRPLTTPAVRVLLRPLGLPMAYTDCPTCRQAHPACECVQAKSTYIRLVMRCSPKGLSLILGQSAPSDLQKFPHVLAPADFWVHLSAAAATKQSLAHDKDTFPQPSFARQVGSHRAVAHTATAATKYSQRICPQGVQNHSAQPVVLQC